MKKFTYASAFSGIGGMTLGLKPLGGEGVIAWEYDPTEKRRQYAQDAHKLLHPEIPVHGDICEANTDELPDFDVFCFTPPCFVAGTLITTADGLKKIEDIDVGDRVLTHTNTFKDVVTPMTKETRGIFKLKVQGSPITYVTPEHPFYVREMKRDYSTRPDGKRNNHRTWGEPKWVDAKDLKPNVHYVGFSENKEAKNPYNLTHEDAWLIGRYVADGYIRHNEEKKRINQVIYCVGKTKLSEFKLNVSKYYIGISEDRTVYKCRISDERLMRLCESAGKGAENKRVPGFIMDLPNDLLEAFLEGYMSGDGCVTKSGFQATSISKSLIFGLAQVVQKLYKVPSQITFTKRPKTTVIEGRTVNQKDTWMIRFKKTPSNPQHSVYIDGMLWCPVRKLTWEDSFEGTVYNFEVADDNSYVANNMTVHNCQAFSVAGKRGGFDDTRGTLTFNALQIAKAKQPKILFMENVKGLINHDKGNTMSTIIHAINEIGYTVDFTVLNSKYFDVAQNRERVYLIAVRDDLIESEPWKDVKGTTMLPKAKRRYQEEGARTFNFDWPEQTEVRTRLRDFLEDSVDERYYLSEDKTAALVKQLEDGLAVKEATKQGYAKAAVGDAVNIQFPNSNTRRGRVGKQMANTLEASGINQGVVERVGNVNPSGNGMNGNVYSIDAGLSPTLTTNKGEGVKVLEDSPIMLGHIDLKGHDAIKRVYSPTGQGPTLTTMGGGHREPKIAEEVRPVLTPDRLEKRQNGRRFKEDGEEAFTLTSIDRHGVAVGEYPRYRIRKLTPTECLKLQSVPQWAIDMLKEEFSDSRLYKFSGNGLTTNVIKAIGERLLTYL